MRTTKRGKVASWRVEQGLFRPVATGEQAFAAVLPDKAAKQGRTICPQSQLLNPARYWLVGVIGETPETSARVFCQFMVTGPESDPQLGQTINLDPSWVYTAEEHQYVQALAVEQAQAKKAQAQALETQAQAKTKGQAKAAQAIRQAKAAKAAKAS